MSHTGTGRIVGVTLGAQVAVLAMLSCTSAQRTSGLSYPPAGPQGADMYAFLVRNLAVRTE